MHEQRVINQQAQDHAAACAFFARLLGQLAPAFMPLPVLHKNLDEPPQRVALDNVERAPTQVGCHQMAVGLFVLVFQRDDEPFGFVGTDIQPGTADEGAYLFASTDADGVGRPGMGRKIVGYVLLALVHADFLIAPYLRDHLHATKHHRSTIDKRRGAIEGICHDTVDPQGGMVGVEPL
jgi:hypothetical protein